MQVLKTKMIKSDRFSGEAPHYVAGAATSRRKSNPDALEALVALSLGSRLDPKHLPARLGYSEAQARRLAVAAAGESVGSFVRRLRLERAAGRLSLRLGSLHEIAVEAGYQTSEAFGRAFGVHFDCLPSRYRKLNPGSNHLHPGYALSVGVLERLPESVQVVLGADRTVRFLYDGPVFLARILPNGTIDWLPR